MPSVYPVIILLLILVAVVVFAMKKSQDGNAGGKVIAAIAQVLLYIYAAVHIVYVLFWTIKPFRTWLLAQFYRYGTCPAGGYYCMVRRLLVRILRPNYQVNGQWTDFSWTIYDSVFNVISICAFIILVVAAIVIAQLLKKKFADKEPVGMEFSNPTYAAPQAQVTPQEPVAPQAYVPKQEPVAPQEPVEENYLFVCSRCGQKMVEFTKFCPNCAAPSSEFTMKM